MTARKGEYKDGLYAPLALIHPVSEKKKITSALKLVFYWPSLQT